MKKIIVLFTFSLFFVNLSFASGLLIFNKSKDYDINIIYNICSTDSGDANAAECGEPMSATIDKAGLGKNFLKIIDKDQLRKYTILAIHSATEKNANGDMVSSGKFGEKAMTGCSAAISRDTTHSALYLDDMSGSPYIMCGYHWAVED